MAFKKIGPNPHNYKTAKYETSSRQTATGK